MCRLPLGNLVLYYHQSEENHLGEDVSVQGVKGQDEEAGLLRLRRIVARLGHRVEDLEIAVTGHQALVIRVHIHAKLIILRTSAEIETCLHAAAAMLFMFRQLGVTSGG